MIVFAVPAWRQDYFFFGKLTQFKSVCNITHLFWWKDRLKAYLSYKQLFQCFFKINEISWKFVLNRICFFLTRMAHPSFPSLVWVASACLPPFKVKRKLKTDCYYIDTMVHCYIATLLHQCILYVFTYFSSAVPKTTFLQNDPLEVVLRRVNKLSIRLLKLKVCVLTMHWVLSKK